MVEKNKYPFREVISIYPNNKTGGGVCIFVLRKNNSPVQNDQNNLIDKTESETMVDESEESPEIMVNPNITDISSAHERECANNEGVSDAYIEEHPVEGYDVIYSVIFLTCAYG